MANKVNKFIVGFLVTIIIISGLAMIAGLYVGGVVLLLIQVVDRFELYGWSALLMVLGYTILFIGIFGGIQSMFQEDDALVSGDEQ